MRSAGLGKSKLGLVEGFGSSMWVRGRAARLNLNQDHLSGAACSQVCVARVGRVVCSIHFAIDNHLRAWDAKG